MTDDTKPGFSLLDEPWILARFHGGSTREVSMREVFAQAHDIVELGGDVSTQAFATVRLLLAVLHSALRQSGEPDEEWALLWESEKPLLADVEPYLEEFRDRFNLLDPALPFYQVAELSTTSGDISSLDKLIVDVPNGEPFFTTRLRSGVDRISFAEAARWVVHCQAFDASGIKSGAVGDDRVRGGKGYPIGVAWAGSLGGLLIEGRNLRETLLLNLVLGDLDGEPFLDEDLPVWERDRLSPGEEKGRGAPRGPADLYTWSSRRIRLIHDEEGVFGVLISNGDPLKPQLVEGIHNLEPMTAWRRSETQEKALGAGRHVYMPLTHDPKRTIWRGLSALLPQGVRETQSKGGSKNLPPLSLEWVRRMSDKGVLPPSPLRTRAIGMEYGSQSATVAEIIDDSLSMNSILLAQQGEQLASLALVAVEQTDAAVFQLWVLARNLTIAKGGESEGPSERIREQAYFALDSPFRIWLSSLGETTDVLEARKAWYAEVRRTLIRLARQAVDAAGPSAWVGRVNIRTGKPVSSVEAFGWFLREVYRVLPDGGEPEKLVRDKESVEMVQ